MELKLLALASCYLTCSVAAYLPKSARSNTNITRIPDAAAIQKAANVSTGNTLCAGGTKYFPQPIHHKTFNGDWCNTNATYLQQYEIFDQFYKPGNPILLYQTPEDPLTCAEDTAIRTWAEELGALAVSLEHRYFGLSCPYGLNYSEAATWDISQMDGLTLENVLLDGVSFITWLTSGGYPAAKGAKVIVIGGMLSDEIVAWSYCSRDG